MNPKTLASYGLTDYDYHYIRNVRQAGRCPICKLELSNEVIDHWHVPRFSKMKPEKKKKYVRGVLHRRCNWRFLGNLVTLEIACNVADYLIEYHKQGVEDDADISIHE